MEIVTAIILGIVALLLLVGIVRSIIFRVRAIVANMPRRIESWRHRLQDYTRLFAKPHLKSTLAVLYVIGMIALLLNTLTSAATIGWLPFGWIAFWLRKEWVADDYYRASKAAADAERARKEARRQREEARRERVREEARREREARRAAPPIVSLYSILGLSENATDTEIRTAYRRLVKRYHPDRSKYSKVANAEMFRQVQEAYAELRARRGSWVN